MAQHAPIRPDLPSIGDTYKFLGITAKAVLGGRSVYRAVYYCATGDPVKVEIWLPSDGVATVDDYEFWRYQADFVEIKPLQRD